MPGIKALWDYEPSDHYIELKVFEGEDCFRGNVLYSFYGRLILTTTEFEVRSGRGRGIGTKLMMSALALAKQHGVEASLANITSPASLRIRQKLFGNLIEIQDTAGYKLDLSVEAAIAQLACAQDWDGPENFDGFNVDCNLQTIDTSGWPLPDELNQPDITYFQNV